MILKTKIQNITNFLVSLKQMEGSYNNYISNIAIKKKLPLL